MCGIVGARVFVNNSYQITQDYIVAMRDTMAHRGPDGVGAWISRDRKTGLGHCRLSIIDLSTTASQPMSNEDGSLFVTFNGEIYNHLEIRKELTALGGHHWKTDHSDTEVILHAFEQWGIECVKKFRGMFAIALWDERKRQLWLIRDRMGIKPLYYSVHHGRITFASEIKALLQDPDQKRTVNEDSFYHYLSFLAAPAPQTFFQGIMKLPSATWLRFEEGGQVYEQRYWDPLESTLSFERSSEQEIAESILSELRASVKYRKISDVPMGVFLSGGIDSSTNAALFSEGEGAGVKTFTIGYQGQYKSYQNELTYARQMAKSIDAQYHERLLTQEDLTDFLPAMVRLQDEPIGDPVCVPLYYVSKLARDHGVTVCQLGEGADELFFGYPYWKRMLDLQYAARLPLARWGASAGLGILSLAGAKQDFPFEFFKRILRKQPVFWGGAEAFTDGKKHKILSSRLQLQFKDRTSWEVIEPIYKRFLSKSKDRSVLSWMSYLDLNLRLPELLLMRVDKMSMGVSLECRVPFLDHKFVELAMAIPESVKIKDGELKHILKKSVRGLIPDNLIDRPKQGFGVPIYEWFLQELGERVRKDMLDFCDATDFLDKTAVLRLFDQGDSPQVWYLFNFVLWWKEYIQ